MNVCCRENMFGTELAKDAWDRACKEMCCWLAFFLLPKFSPKNGIKILELKKNYFWKFSITKKKVLKIIAIFYIFFYRWSPL